MVNLVVGTIDKDVLFLRMTMHINHSLDAAFILREVFRVFISDAFNHALDCKDLTMELLMWPFILAIQITTRKR